MTKYFEMNPRDFLAVATPGAGKTTFALSLARALLDNHTVRQVIVVVPTEHLKTQWAEAALRFGIMLDANFSNSSGALNPSYQGMAVTYAQVSMHPYRHQALATAKKTLVILDEIHHGGDAKSWGDGIRYAYQECTRRLALTGTPFRSDDSPIPFVRYIEDGEGHQVSQADHTYGYADALRDGVVRPVVFLAYSGQARWRDSAGEEFEARLGEPLTAENTARAWKAALDPKGEWIPAVMRAAHVRLTELRRSIPDAGGLVIASDTTTARAYAKILERLSGRPVTVVLSDEAGSSAKIEQFAASTDEWMVAVRMVSEGVDVPRLAVGVYATSASTPLFFAQAIGRFVRSRRPGETASVFLPSVPVLLDLAAQLEAQRNHVLGKPDRPSDGLDDELIAQANRTEGASDELHKYEIIGSDAELDHVIYDGSSYGTGTIVGSEEEADYLGLPGLLNAEQMKMLLQERQKAQIAAREKAKKQADAARHRMLYGDANHTVGYGGNAGGSAGPHQTAAGAGYLGGVAGAGGVGAAGATPLSTAGAAGGAGAATGAARAASHRAAADDLPKLRKELNALVSIRAARTGRPHGQIHTELRQKCGGPPIGLATADQIRARIAYLRNW